MPVNRCECYTSRSENPPRKYALILSCVDARLLDDLVHFLDQENLINRYYHLTLAGTAMGLTREYATDLLYHCDTQCRKPCCDPHQIDDRCDKKCFDSIATTFEHWRETFVSQVQAAVTLTKGELTDIYIIQHEDCGAFRIMLGKDYKDLSKESERDLHKRYGKALQKDIVDNFCETYNPSVNAIADCKEKVQKHKPFVHLYYMDLRGELTLMSTIPEGRTPPECPCSGSSASDSVPPSTTAAKKGPKKS